MDRKWNYTDRILETLLGCTKTSKFEGCHDDRFNTDYKTRLPRLFTSTYYEPAHLDLLIVTIYYTIIRLNLLCRSPRFSPLDVCAFDIAGVRDHDELKQYHIRVIDARFKDSWRSPIQPHWPRPVSIEIEAKRADPYG